MKKLLIINAMLALLALGATNLQAQYNAYKMVLKSNGKCLTNDNGTLTLEDVRTNSGALAQLFTIKRVADNKMLIVSASDNNLYVKRSGASVVLSSHSGNSDLEYSWELNYAGDGYVYIAKSDATQLTLRLSGTSLGYSQPPSLSSQTDTAADNFRFSLVEVANTF